MPEKDTVTGEDWNVIRVALECLELDGAGVEFQREVEDLYAKLQRMGLVWMPSSSPHRRGTG